MLATLLLAACAQMPYFPADPYSGPACLNPATECQCGECFAWDAPVEVPDSARVDYYEVRRINPDGTMILVGGTSRMDWLDEVTGMLHITDPVRVWCPAKDTPMPQEGQLYGYLVRACNNERGCGSYSNGIEYRAAPYATSGDFDTVGNP